MSLKRVGFALSFACVVSFVHDARAQDTARAQALYNEGAVALESGDVPLACERFEGARSLLTTPVILNAVARCHESLGKIATAAGELDELTVLYAQRNRPADAAAARDRAEALKKRMPFLVISVADADRASVELLQDGRPFPRAALGVSLPIDPGEHWVEASAPGRATSRKTVKVEEGERAAVAFETLAPQEEKKVDQPAPPPAPTKPALAPRPPPPSPLRLPLYVAGGLAVAGTLTAGIAGTYAYLQQRDARERCPSPTNLCLDRAGLAANERARTAYPIAMVGGAVGVTGALLVGYLGVRIWGEKRAEGLGLGVGPVVGGREAGVVVGGSL